MRGKVAHRVPPAGSPEHYCPVAMTLVSIVVGCMDPQELSSLINHSIYTANPDGAWIEKRATEMDRLVVGLKDGRR